MFQQLIPVFASFENHNVRYLVIGGVAAVHYGINRLTKDLDLFIEATPDNASRLLIALGDAKFGTASLITAEELAAQELTIFEDRVRIDVLTKAAGLDFSTAWNSRKTFNFSGHPIQLISKNDLILAKKACGRPQDLEDVQRLLSLK